MALLGVAPAALAQHVAINPTQPIVGAPSGGGGACSGGEIWDDGVPENGYGWTSTVTSGLEAMQFTPSSYPFSYTDVCICWVRLGADTTIDFNINVYDDDGTGGGPGTLLGSVPAQATGVPNTLPGTWYQVDISAMNLAIASGNVYIAAQWNPSVDQQFFLCVDESVTTPLRTGYGSSDGAATWTALQVLFPNYRALLLRALGGNPYVPPVTQEIPTLGGIGLAALLLLLGGTAVWILYRRRAA